MRYCISSVCDKVKVSNQLVASYNGMLKHKQLCSFSITSLRLGGDLKDIATGCSSLNEVPDLAFIYTDFFPLLTSWQANYTPSSTKERTEATELSSF